MCIGSRVIESASAVTLKLPRLHVYMMCAGTSDCSDVPYRRSRFLACASVQVQLFVLCK